MSTLSQTSTDEAGEPASPTLPASAMDQVTSTSQPWWRIGDFAVLGIYASVVLWTIQYHEKWVDEAQAWLFARDLDLRTLWFYELRYEGSPGLWHTILWVAQRVFHARYDSINYIGAAFAIAGAALLIFKAPFPRYIRWPLAFTYFMVYQYAVIARQYTLLPLLAFAVATLFKDLEHPGRLTIVLVLLANLSFHGAILAACLALAYVVEAVPSWRNFDPPLRTRYWICLGVLALTFIFVCVVVRPAPDSLELLVKHGLLRQPNWTNSQGQVINPLVKFNTVISGAFFDYPVPSTVFLLLAAVWCFTRRKLLVFVLPVALLAGLYSFVYGTPHHHGTVFVGAIAGLWIAWPSENERRTLARRESRMLQGMAALLLCLCALNIWDSVVVLQREYLYPYSGAEDAAKYLKAVGAEHRTIFGYGFGVSAVQAYFDQKIMANIPTSYTHNGLPAKGLRLDVDELQQVSPEYLVVDARDPQKLLEVDGPVWVSLGYEIVHFSDGYYFYKRGVYEREAFFIYKRVAPGASQTLPQSGPGKPN